MTGDQRRPNVLLITADQLRWDCLGCYGNPVIQTPHIDKLAAEGIRFSNAHTAATLCVPARLSILTGQYPSSHGAKGNGSALPGGTPTIASLFRDAGYTTGAFGKMHFRPTYADYGFQAMELSEQHGNGRFDDDYHSRYLANLGLEDQWDAWDQVASERKSAPQEYWDSYGTRRSELLEEHYHTTWIADRTINYLTDRTESDNPFFVWTSFIKPHHPFDPPAPYDTMYSPEEVLIPQPSGGWEGKPLLNAKGDPRRTFFDTRTMTEGQLRTVIAHYYGLISQIDKQIGRIVETLKAQGIDNNTLIILTSDHGDYLGQYGLFLKQPNIPYGALAKIPLVFGGGWLSQASKQSDDLLSLIDLFPTLLTLAHIEHDVHHQGQDFSAMIKDAEADSFETRPILIETDSDIRAVCTDRYKYIFDTTTRLEELYDLRDDPDETVNIAPSHPMIVQDLRLEMLDLMASCAWDRYYYGK